MNLCRSTNNGIVIAIQDPSNCFRRRLLLQSGSLGLRRRRRAGLPLHLLIGLASQAWAVLEGLGGLRPPKRRPKRRNSPSIAYFGFQGRLCVALAFFEGHRKRCNSAVATTFWGAHHLWCLEATPRQGDKEQEPSLGGE
jgi:hypothetical protein